MFGAALLLAMQAVSVPAAEAVDAAAAIPESGRFELACANPVGSTVYLPGGIVPPDIAMVRQDDGFTGLVIVRLTAQQGRIQVADVIWIRAEQRLSARETGLISQTVTSESGTISVFLGWADGSSDTLLVSSLQSERPILAYTSAYTDSQLERVSHFTARCEWLQPES